jgi:hypothetical protein
MAHTQRQQRMLGFALVLILPLLVQSDYGFPARQMCANRSPRVLSHNLGLLAGVVLTGSHHIVGGLETLYELRQLAIGASQTEGSSGRVSENSSSTSSAEETVCFYRATPGPSGTAYRCLAPGRSGNTVAPIHHC